MNDIHSGTVEHRVRIDLFPEGKASMLNRGINDVITAKMYLSFHECFIRRNKTSILISGFSKRFFSTAISIIFKNFFY